MPWRIDVDAAASRCVVHLVGVVTPDDVKAGLHARAQAGAWTMPTLIDGSEITHLAVHWTDMVDLSGALTSLARSLPPRAKTALLASDAVQFGMSRMYQTAMTRNLQLDMEVFADRAAAEAWLGWSPTDRPEPQAT